MDRKTAIRASPEQSDFEVTKINEVHMLAKIFYTLFSICIVLRVSIILAVAMLEHHHSVKQIDPKIILTVSFADLLN